MSRPNNKSPRVRGLVVDQSATRALIGQINRAARTPEKLQPTPKNNNKKSN